MRLALLSVADLSFILPMTAIGYVLAAVLGRFFLHEARQPAAMARRHPDFRRRGAGQFDTAQHDCG